MIRHAPTKTMVGSKPRRLQLLHEVVDAVAWCACWEEILPQKELQKVKARIAKALRDLSIKR
jgi:hypothetical protein